MLGNHYLKNVVTLKYDREKCIGCKMCVQVCPHAVFRMEGSKAVLVEKDDCMECGACARNCPSQAITVRAGVGCASGVIKGFLTNSEPTCDCVQDGKKSSSCC